MPRLTLTPRAVAPVAAVVVLVVLGFVLPYVSLEYVNLTSQRVTSTEALSGAASLLGTIDPTYLTNFGTVDPRSMNIAFNLAAAGPNIQQVAAVVVALSCWCVLTEEINKFFWWPLHLASYPLVLATVPLLVGVGLASSADVPITLGPGFVPLTLAGGLAWWLSWRSRGRIDSYSSF